MSDEFPRGYEEHRRQQLRRQLRLTAAERLRWLEDARQTFSRWCRRAREAQGK